jgi:serine/threonine protein kinase
VERLMSLGCPYIVKLLGAGTIERSRFFILEWVDGLALDEYLRIAERRQERIQLMLVLRWLEELARGLHAIHQAGQCHLALSPSKLLLDKTRHLRIVDFGLSNLTVGGSPSESSTVLAGDMTYRAPEQLGGSRPIGPKADQFALGLIAHELIAGAKMPALGRVDDSGLRCRRLTDAMTLRIRSVLLQLLAEDPNQRFASCADVANAFRELSELRAQQRSTVPPGRERPRANPPSRQVHTPPVPSPPESHGRSPGNSGATRVPASRPAIPTRDEPVDFEPVIPELDDEPAVVPAQKKKKQFKYLPLVLCASLAILLLGVTAWLWMGRRSDGTNSRREREASQNERDELYRALQSERELRKKVEGRIQEIDAKMKSSADVQNVVGDLNKKLESERAKSRRLEEAIEHLQKQLKSGPPPVAPDHSSVPTTRRPT